jgi:uncharacterized RDD family membrane protein YckC
MTDKRDPKPPAPRSPASRLLGAGARGAGRVAGATGVDKAVEDAMEEAIVRALRSPAVERAIVRVMQRNAVQDAFAEALTSDEVADAVVKALDTEVAGRVWEELLASDKAQMLVERIAEAPEVRAAIAQQGVGLITDIGRRLTIITEALDDAIERVTHGVFRSADHEAETNQVGLVTRAVAAAIDIGLLAVAFSLASSLLRWIVPAADSGDGPSLVTALGVSGLALLLGGAYFVIFWGLVGQTPGMRFLSINLDAHGSREIGYRRAQRRLLAIPLALLPLGLGFLAILRSPTRQGWHDRIAGTTVVYDKRDLTAPWSTIETPAAAPRPTVPSSGRSAPS